MSTYTEEQLLEMIAAYQGGASLAEAGRIHGMADNSLRKHLVKRGIARRPRPQEAYTGEQIEEMIEAYQDGATLEEAAALHGTVPATIRNHCNRLGIARRPRWRPCQVDHAYFDRWSPSMAWLLGYICADGSVGLPSGRPGSGHRLRFNCSVKDEHIIHDIQREMKHVGKVGRRAPHTGGTNGRSPRIISGGPMVSVHIHSPQIATTLIERFGILPRKSFLDVPMPPIPDEWLGHFTRGLIDGDGTICRSQMRGGQITRVTVRATIQFAESLQRRISGLLGVRRNKITANGCELLREFSWGGRSDVAAILRWLYPPGEYLHLKRKKAVADRHFVNFVDPGSRSNRLTAIQWDEVISTYKGGTSLGITAATHGLSKQAVRQGLIRRRLLRA